MTSLTIHDARVWTGDPARPRARSVRIADGRIREVADAPRAPGPRSDVVIDAGGRTVTPGLVDAHLHLLSGGLSLSQLDLSAVTSPRAFRDAVAEGHAQLPAGRWLIARGWSSEKWPGRQLPDKTWLAAAGERPVACHRSDLHAVLVNDAVLAHCDTGRDPPGGRIVRDAAGDPTGLMLEAAAWRLVNPLIPSPGAAERRRALLAAQTLAHRLGLTAAGSMEYQCDVAEAYVPIRDRLTLRCRITLLDRGWPMSFDDARAFDNDATLAVIGCKAFADGTLGSRTARMLAPYDDDPGNRGLLVELAAEGHLADWAAAVAAAGLSPSIHAIGDEAARLALDALEGVDPAARPRIEHVQQIDPADAPRFAGRVASMQPAHKHDDGCYLAGRVGPARLAGAFAFRTLLRAGARLAFGSDWTAGPLDPLAGIRCAVTGVLGNGAVLRPEENLTVEEALTAYTAGAAYALGLDDGGVLRPGAPGALVMFDRDPFTADWIDAPPRIVMTVAGGVVVYDEAS